MAGRHGWGEQELKQLEVLVKEHGRKWTRIGKELGRSASSVKDAVRNHGLDQPKRSSNFGSSSSQAWGVEANALLREVVKKHEAEHPGESVPWATGKGVAGSASCFLGFS